MEIHETEEYGSALIKVKSWKEKIEKSDRVGLFRILDEKKIFFANMKKTNPNLYSIFQINDKEISESVAEKLSAAKITID
ncbi:hypothetical protein KKE92_03405 [Candidatus Micrarchaeota archaeon]|nr:hypothetical protein [Candidatus Micrarchaeota archaeon]MBU1681215.1 hypothetical protein [Candidatus Micrarchaeota archaeon]